jgi:hypothetical protein
LKRYWIEACSRPALGAAPTGAASMLATGQIAAAVWSVVGKAVTAHAEPNARYRLLAQAAIAIDTARRVAVTKGRCVGMEGAMGIPSWVSSSVQSMIGARPFTGVTAIAPLRFK